MLLPLIAFWLDTNSYHINHDVYEFSRFGHQWKYESIGASDLLDSNIQDFHVFSVKRDGKVVYKDNSQQFAGYLLGSTRMRTLLPYEVLVRRAHTWCGSGCYTTFLQIKGNRCVKMGYFNTNCGGPIFKDFDGDGEMEWMFDDYDHYKYYGDPPKWLLVFKVSSKGKLVLWKKLKNKKKIRLKDTVGLVW